MRTVILRKIGPGLVRCRAALHGWVMRLAGRDRRPRHGSAGIRTVGHRTYVGGLWDEMGRLQFDFLVAQGLRPDHVFLDIACGSLRAGSWLIPFLEPGRYLGVDKEQKLIRAGIERELDPELYRERAPEFVVTGDFEFERLSQRPDYALAQSLFTHLPERWIRRCLSRLRRVMKPAGRFYATYFEAASTVVNPLKPHDHGMFRYARDQMWRFGVENGWTFEYIGDWGHPRGQVMVLYRPQEPASADTRVTVPDRR